MNFTEKKLLNEIQRFREIIGLPPILTEGREKLLSSVGDLKKAAIDAFGTATRTSPEGVFVMKIQSAADETAIAKILRDPVNVRFTKKLIGDTLMISGGRASQTIEFMIKRAYDKGYGKDKIMSDMKTKVNEWFDSPYLDDIIDYYEGSILEVYGGRNADDVFGRKVENPNPKKNNKSDPNASPKFDLAGAKANMKQLTALIPDKEVRDLMNKQIDELTEDTFPVNPQTWVTQKTNDIYDLKTNLIRGEGKVLDAQREQSKKEREAANQLVEDVMKGTTTKMTLGRKLLWTAFLFAIVALFIYLCYRFGKDPRGTFEDGVNHFRKTSRSAGIDENTIKETEQKVISTAKKVAAPPQSTAFDK